MKLFYSLFIILFFSQCRQKDSAPFVTGKEGQRPPEFRIGLADGVTQKTISEIKSTGPYVIFYFKHGCPYSRMEMRRITSNIDDFKGMPIIVITGEGVAAMTSFSREFELSKFTNVITGVDVKYNVAAYFRPNAVPFIAIFDSKGKLKKAFTGAISLKQLLKNTNA